MSLIHLVELDREAAMQLLNRRQVLSSSAAAVGSALLAPQSMLADTDASSLFPPGIQLYAVRDALAADTSGTLKALAAMGYREVETAGFGNYSAKQFRSLCAEAGLRVPSAHLPLQGASDVPAVLAQANDLGAQYAVSSVLYDFSKLAVPQQGTPTTTTVSAPSIGVEGFKKMAVKMNSLGQQAKAAGLQYAYHNHNFEFEKLPDGRFGYDLLLSESDPDFVKFEMDCGWLEVGGADPVKHFTEYPGRFRMIHVKDFKARTVSTKLSGPERPIGTELGTGFIKYGPIIRAAKRAGVLHAFAEQEAPYARSQMASAQVSYDYLLSVEKNV